MIEKKKKKNSKNVTTFKLIMASVKGKKKPHKLKTTLKHNHEQ
jgi:hypothetical protein